MKLLSLKIKGFKNLDIDLDFTKSESISVFVGTNGSGKSNILEAIAGIFAGINENGGQYRPQCNYEMIYQKGDDTIQIVHIHSKGPDGLPDEIIKQYESIGGIGDDTIINMFPYYVNGKYSKNLDKKYWPSNIIALYSGEETRLYETYYKPIEEEFIEDLKKGRKSISDHIPMIYVDKSFWDIALIVMGYGDVELKELFGEFFEIDRIGLIPNRKNIEKLQDGELKDFLKVISSHEVFRNIEHMKDIDIADETNGVFGNRVDLFKKLFLSHRPDKNGEKLIEDTWMIFYDHIIKKEENEDSEFPISIEEYYSEGIKKFILLYFIMFILADRDSIILLDEPDSHIHVGKKEKIIDIIKGFLQSSDGEGEFIITTHSPTLMNLLDEKHIFNLESGKLVKKERQEILKEISGNNMSYTDQQIVLNTTKDILIVEGKTDEIYIKTALKKLKIDHPQYNELDFEFILMGGSDYEVLKGFSEKFPAKQEQRIIAFFDRDDAGFTCIKKALGDSNLQKDSFNGKQLNDIHINLYPKKEDFTESDFVVEDYFKIETILNFIYPNGVKSFRYTNATLNKGRFAEHCPSLGKEEFEGFKTLFDFIKKIS